MSPTQTQREVLSGCTDCRSGRAIRHANGDPAGVYEARLMRLVKTLANILDGVR